MMNLNNNCFSHVVIKLMHLDSCMTIDRVNYGNERLFC